MKAFVAILALFLAMTMAQAQVQPENNDNDNNNENGNEPAWWFNYPHPYPYTLYYPQYALHPHPHPPKPSSPHFSHAQKKCFKAVHDPDLAACKNDYLHFLHTHKPKVSSDCCSALENIGAHCPILKARHPFIAKILKHHCPSPPSPSPTGN